MPGPAAPPTTLRTVVFSKDRPLQLHAALESLRSTCVDPERLDVRVVVFASDDQMARRYAQVAREVPWARLVGEDGFKETLLAAVDGAEHLLFVVDDALFVRPWSASATVEGLSRHPEALGVSLRLGRNTTTCYVSGTSQHVPPLLPVASGWLALDWTTGDQDFGYPLEVSSSVFRARDLFPLLDALPYRNPNELEATLAGRRVTFAATRPVLLCPELSVAFCAPVNVVQSTFPNRAGTRADHSPASLGALFDQGLRVDVAALRGFTPTACHQEVELPLLAGPPPAAASAPEAAPAASSPAQAPVAPESEVEKEEFAHLAPLLHRVAPSDRRAVDVGANVGGVTLHLARMGYAVLAFEPNPDVAAVVRRRLAAEGLEERAEVLEVAASDREGTADLLIGSADTVATLDPEWTRVAFPELFVSQRRVRVRTQRLAGLLRQLDATGTAFLKIDVEGHEPAVLAGLLEGAAPAELPAVVMFEANQRFPDQARACLRLLRAAGYGTFDVFIKQDRVLGATRFDGADLPAIWAQHDRPGVYFYANFIAYHAARLPESALPPAPGLPGQAPGTRQVFERAMAAEAAAPFPTHPEWEAMRRAIRGVVTEGDLSRFLHHPVCRGAFVRVGHGAPQEHELREVRAEPDATRLLALAADPPVGGPLADTPVSGLSANALGMLYYLVRLRRSCGGELPASVVEIGGGYGALALQYGRLLPQVAYVIADLPEMLALQHHFLRAADPSRTVVLADKGPVRPLPGQVTLVPVSRLGELPPPAVLLSTFALSEMPREAQQRVERLDYLGARRLFLAGQLASEAPRAGWVAHRDVIGPIVERWRDVAIERFHIGENYLLQARR